MISMVMECFLREILLFLQADVLVVDFDSQYTSRPWTKNYGSCGQQGDSIYMSPDYILEPKYEKIFGSKGTMR